MRVSSERYNHLSSLQALESLSNAILRDDRIFHISESRFLELYNNQGEAVTSERLRGLIITSVAVQIEHQLTGAWSDHGPQHVMAEALKLQQTSGWNACRMAITTTIRLVFDPARVLHCHY